MPKKGLSKESITDAAIRLIEEQGHHAFSMNELARRLGVKTASLYNHIQSMEELMDEVGARIAGMLRQAEHEAIEGKSREEALFALCNAYRAFANENMELYKVNIGRQLVGKDFEKAAKGEIIDPMLKVISDFELEESERMNWHRILRSMMHGCVTQEYARPKKAHVDNDKIYQMAIETVVLGIHAAEHRTGSETADVQETGGAENESV